VPTPILPDKRPDIRSVEQAVTDIAPLLKQGDLVILESTSPVGTTKKMLSWLSSLRPDLTVPSNDEEADIAVCYCPERVLPGKILKELVNNDRLIGGVTQRCAQLAQAFYQTFVKGSCHITQAVTAELAKLTENAYRDVNIAFANELSMICDQVDCNVSELIALANHHPRVNILQPGPGVGGHCIAVDPWFIVDAAPKQANLIRTARNVNDTKTEHVLQKIQNTLECLDNPVVACLGLAFKPNVDDLRGSPALTIVNRLASSTKHSIQVVEPHIESLPDALSDYHHVQLQSLEQAMQQADVIVILVAHRLFLNLNQQILQSKIMIDTCGVNNYLCAASAATADTFAPIS
jgi:UDP-N-acetyl-D-mannosaminuronic acid dehydrogenase